MIPGLIVVDMLLLAIEDLVTPVGLLAMAGLLITFAVLRWRTGARGSWLTAVACAAGSAMFILAQTGRSAWGSGLMIYLLPIQLAIWSTWMVVTVGFSLVRR